MSCMIIAMLPHFPAFVNRTYIPYKMTFSTRPFAKSRYTLSAALRLPKRGVNTLLLMIGRSLRFDKLRKIRASTIFRISSNLAELLLQIFLGIYLHSVDQNLKMQMRS